MTKSSVCTERNKQADIYREAARMIEKDDETFTCCAIAYKGGFFEKWDQDSSYRPLVISEYINTFAETEGGLQTLFDESEDSQNIRILALCFMAAITERP